LNKKSPNEHFQKMKHKLIFLLLTIVFIGCTAKQPLKKDAVIQVNNPFNDKEVSWFKNKGTGNIKGNAKFKSKNGELRYGEQFRVELMPYSLYAEERLGKIYANKNSDYIYLEDGIPKFTPDPEGYHETIKTFCNKNGDFEFNNLPEGKYYVIAFMIWENQTLKTGGAMMQKITLSESQSKVIKMVNY
jgi:hypothetical protein